MSDKRIIDLEAKQTLGSGDYLAADSAQGTYKVDANTNIMTPLTNVRNNVANSSASPDKYSSSTAYKVGDMVIHDDILYICTTACSAASWAVNSACFTATTLSSAITQLNSDLTTLGTADLLFHGHPTTASTYQTKSVISGKKFSDYAFLIFAYKQYNNTVSTIIEPSDTFKTQQSSGSRVIIIWGADIVAEVYYVSDTQLALKQVPIDGDFRNVTVWGALKIS